MNLKILSFVVCIFTLSVILVSTKVSYASRSDDQTSIDEVQEEAGELFQTLKSYLIAQRTQAVDKTEKALDNLDKQIDELENRLYTNWEKMDEAAREKANSSLKTLHKKRVETAEWYGRLKSSSAEAWDNIKKGLSDAYKDLYMALEKSEEEFNSQDK